MNAQPPRLRFANYPENAAKIFTSCSPSVNQDSYLPVHNKNVRVKADQLPEMSMKEEAAGFAKVIGVEMKQA
jgi:hypothetical protein